MNEINKRKAVENILSVLDNASGRRVTVFGDFCLDKYLYINSKRDEKSLETGLTAYQVEKKALFPGVGGTVANNLRTLDVHVQCVGLSGNDGEGYELIKGLNDIGAETELMVRSDDIMTCTYIKPMRGSKDEPYNEINRFDIRNFKETTRELEDKLLINLNKALDTTEGVVITDQFLELNYSVVTDRIRREISEMPKRLPGKVFFADSRKYAGNYSNIIIKCNRYELPSAGGAINDVIAGGKDLLSKNGYAAVVTAGAGGAYTFEGKECLHVPAFNVEGPLDIVGAGDATNAGVILGLTLGLRLNDAVLLGSCISSITIQQIGVTGTATISQIKQRLSEYISG